MICVSLPAANGAEVLAGMDLARKSGADLVEIRADYFPDRDEIGEILERKSLPVLVTLRSVAEGGRFEGGNDERFSFLENMASRGADWLDVEWKQFRSFSRGSSRVVLSYHDMEKTPGNLDEIRSAMKKVPCDQIKIAVRAHGVADLLRLLKLGACGALPETRIAMGEFGEPLRILTSRFGGGMAFASLARGEETAPGQLSVSELLEDFRVRKIDRNTRFYGVVGNPVAHSRSPELFNQVFERLSMNARYLRIPLDDPALFPSLRETLQLAGGSITLPHKEELVGALDETDPMVAEMGAVNTFVKREGKWCGFNTDAPAAAEVVREAAMRQGGELRGSPGLVLGAGGVARAIAWGLLKEGVRVTLANRTLERARVLAKDLQCDVIPWEERGNLVPRVVVNATSVGMDGRTSPFPEEEWRKEMVVLDAVYTPRRTPFLEAAAMAGAETVDGVGFFLRQANLQCHHFLGCGIPGEIRNAFAPTR